MSLLAIGLAQSTDPLRSYIETKANAYYLLPPDFVCGPQITSLAWSQDGERLAISRDVLNASPTQMADILDQKQDAQPPADPISELLVWNTVSRKATSVLRLHPNETSIQDFQWMAGSSKLVVILSDERNPDQNSPERGLLVSMDGTVHAFANLEPNQLLQIEPSPLRPLVGLIVRTLPNIPAGADAATVTAARAKETKPSLSFLRMDGSVSVPIEIPTRIYRLLWSSNGLPYLVTIERNLADKTRKNTWFAVDVDGHKLVPSASTKDLEEKLATFQDPSASADVMLENLSPTLALKKIGVAAPTVTISSKQMKDPIPCVVTTDGSRGELSPKLNAVIYQSQGNLMARSITKVSLDALKRARLVALKTKLLNQVKQVGLALIMNAGDNNDMYPSNKGDWQSGVMPYLMNQDLFNGFNYTLGSMSASALDNPASTEMGYVDGPGGRAVVYADGHSRWVPNRP